MTALEREDPRVVRTREAVYQATIDIIVESGYEGLNIDAISKRSGVARTTIYRHWESAAQIMFDAAMAMKAGAVADILIEPVKSFRAESKDRFRAFVKHLFETRYGALMAASIDAGERDPEIAEMQRQFAADRSAQLRTFLQMGVDSGEIDPNTDLDMVVEITTGTVFRRRFMSRQPADEDFIDRLHATIWRLMTD